MTPVRAFLYFFVILVVFGLFLFLRDRETEKPAHSVMPGKQSDTAVYTPQPKAYQQPLPGNNSRTVNNEAVRYLKKIPLAFAVNDSMRLRYLAEKLQNPQNTKQPVRIIYFGDSQIENDQITSALREQFQRRYGGKGPGFIPLDACYNTHHQLMAELSKNWEIKSFQDKDFIPQSILFKDAKLAQSRQHGWFRLKRIRNLGPQPDYRRLDLYYQAIDTCRLIVKEGLQTADTVLLPPEDEVSVFNLKFENTPDEIRFEFYPRDTLNLCGLSLETETGVLVDNIALRGLSYPTFDQADQEKLKQMFARVNVGLFVLHFGVNLVPYLSDNYQHFKNNFQKQIDFLKETCPGVPILIVGVSDMAEKQGLQFVSFSNIPAISAVQREIALENKAAFWDLRSLMGGEGSIAAWVAATPPLARTDYVHFTEKGAMLVGEALAQAIFDELNSDSTQAP